MVNFSLACILFRRFCVTHYPPLLDISPWPRTEWDFNKPETRSARHIPMALSDFPRPFIAIVLLFGFMAGPRGPCARAGVDSSASREETFRACAGSSTKQGQSIPRASGADRVAFALSDIVSTLKLYPLSRLNSRPALSPLNAFPAPLRPPAHDPGPMWLAWP